MKKTQRKDTRRNIWKQKVSFLSIIVIALLGVVTFLSIDYTAVGLRQNGSEMYNRVNFRDIEVISTLLFSEDDLQDLKKTDGVTDVEAVRMVSAEASFGEARENINVVSMTERISQLELHEGRLPTAADECALEKPLAETLGVKAGDRILLSDSIGEKVDYLRQVEFTVTGIVNHPDHANNIVIEPLYAVTTWDAFDGEALDGCFMKAEITVEKPENMDRFSEKYEKIVAAVQERIDELAVSATVRREKELSESAQRKIDEAKTLLDEGFDQLEAAKETVRNKLRDLVETVFKQSDERELFHWAETRKANLDDPNETAKYLWLTQNLRIDLSRSPEDIFRAVVSSESISDKLLVAVYKYVQKTDAPQNESGEYDMEAVRESLVASATVYAQDYQALSDGCHQWDDGHAQYIEGLETYRQKMAEFRSCRWLLFDGKGNASFAQLIVGSQNFSNLKMTFSLLFILVGGLVIFATVGKMVDEQRSLVGTVKALGFFTREIFAKYLVFGVSATLIGILLGTLMARFAIEPFLLGGFSKYYNFDLSKPVFSVSSTAIVLVFGTILTVLAVWFACNRLLREPAVSLMQPKAPGVKKGSSKRRGRMLSLYSRLILLNMRTDLKRVAVTIVSVAGCCALVIIGLTLKSSVTGAMNKQYSEIIEYDYLVKYDPEATGNGGKDYRDLIDGANAESTSIYNANVTYRFGDLQIADLLCGDLQSIGKYYHLYDWKTGEPIRPTDRGVLVPRRIAETCNLSVGSEFDLAIGGTNVATVRVAGIFESFVGRAIIMSSAYFEKAYETTYTSNAYMIRLNGADGEKLNEDLRALDGFESSFSADSSKAFIESSMSMLDTVMLLFIFIAGIMAGVVLLNLTNMYILQKKRELIIMRINGFTVKEVIHYILRETVMTTVLGIILGIGAGAGCAYSIVRTLEQSFLQLKRSPDPLAWLAAAGITVLFTVIVNAIALRKVKNLRMTDLA